MLGFYSEPIIVAILVFPFIAVLFTLSFIIFNYRRYGGIAVMRVMVVYSFILYCMCAYLLTVLPMPDFDTVAAMETHPIGWIPYRDLYEALLESGLTFSDPQSFANGEAWRRFLTSGDMFQMLANIVLLMPLGFYLRYYFRLSLRKTLLIGFLASLFLELTQLSGLYGLYAKPYRFTEMDDLINNTLGSGLGYALEPLIVRFLPSREEIDRLSYLKGRSVTLSRKVFSMLLDVLACTAALGIANSVFEDAPKAHTTLVLLGFFLLYFAAIPFILKGRTLGQAILKLRTMDEHGLKTASFVQLLGRNILLFCVEPIVLLACIESMAAFVVVLFAEDMGLWYRMLMIAASLAIPVAAFPFFMYVQREWDAFPHSHYSHTVVISDHVRLFDRAMYDEAAGGCLAGGRGDVVARVRSGSARRRCRRLRRSLSHRVPARPRAPMPSDIIAEACQLKAWNDRSNGRGCRYRAYREPC